MKATARRRLKRCKSSGSIGDHIACVATLYSIDSSFDTRAARETIFIAQLWRIISNDILCRI